MAEPAGHVELVIRTASSLLVGRLAAREAVTILATQTPRAMKRAAEVARRDPAKARSYATLLLSVDAALAEGPATGQEATDLAAVRQDLSALAQALQP